MPVPARSASGGVGRRGGTVCVPPWCSRSAIPYAATGAWKTLRVMFHAYDGNTDDGPLALALAVVMG